MPATRSPSSTSPCPLTTTD
ncbi:hypothetical protein FFLO_01325 [Filobasidium floriforme]|uniref:Uncharacterized protein n=1 Tax=Filobasidium floriforme TaxID=5210 RepID=A0A8K0JQX9_9TREE|nr:hypothetical protein FFLO_01325 [Filobasidium floriforme]